MRNVTLKQLRVLAAIAKSGQITSAAKHLGVTPPAVTLQLKLLEENVGMPLFDRSSRGLRPTDAGSYMLQTEARIASTLAECDEGLKQLKGLGRGRVSLGTVSTTKYFAPLALAAFSRENPDIELELLVGHRNEITAALTNLKIDMAIMGRPPKKIEIERQVIGDHPHVIIGPPDHRLASRSRIPLRWLVNDTFLLRESGSGTRILTDQMFAKADLAPSFGMEFGSNETIKQAVMAGLGVAFISAHTVAAEVAQGRMIVLQVTGLPVVRKWYLLRAKAKHLLPAGTALWKFLVKHGGRFPPDVSALVGRSKSRARSRKR